MSNVVEGVQADHHKYIIDGMIDAEVVERQSRKQAKGGSSSYVHHHRRGESCKDHKHQRYGNVLNVSGNLFQPLLNKPS